MLKRAFTLIELLVVIAIIAILAAILFPVFAQAKIAAKKTADLSNHKQIALGFFMYANDFDDILPLAFPNNTLGSYTTPWNRTPPTSLEDQGGRQAFWTNSVYPYSKNYAIDQVVGGTYWNYFGINDALVNPSHYSFGITYNAYLNAWNSSAVQTPTDTVLTWPGTANQNMDGFANSFPLPYFKTTTFPSGNPATPPYQFTNTGTNCMAGLGVYSGFSAWNYDVYGNGFNMSYCDGHSKYVQAASSRSPWSVVNAKGEVLEYNYDSIDGPQSGCYYVAPMAPIRSSSVNMTSAAH